MTKTRQHIITAIIGVILLISTVFFAFINTRAEETQEEPVTSVTVDSKTTEPTIQPTKTPSPSVVPSETSTPAPTPSEQTTVKNPEPKKPAPVEKKTTPSVKPAPVEKKTTPSVKAYSSVGHTTTSAQYVRSGAGSKYPVLTTITQGQTYTITGVSNGWFQIKTSAGTGFVSGSYFKEGKAPVAPKEPTVSKGTQSTTPSKPSPSKKPAATQGGDALSRFSYYASAAGCSGVPVIWNNYNPYGAAYDYPNKRFLLGKHHNPSRLQYIATHECQHYKQHREYGWDWSAAFDALGGEVGVECDADRRTARILGYDIGHYSTSGQCG